MVKDMKGWKSFSCTCKVVVKDYSGAQKKNMKSHIVPTNIKIYLLESIVIGTLYIWSIKEQKNCNNFFYTS